MDERIIIFEGINNCRDLGGIINSAGRQIRRGLLFRSANLADASEADLTKLKEECRVRRIVDLRTSKEREERPDRVPAGAVYDPLPLFDGPLPGISHEQESKIMTGELPFMDMLYRGLAGMDACRKNIGRAVTAVMQEALEGNGVLWHCTEGKDRCGLVSAALLASLGVSREVIMADYLMTNLVNGPKAERYYRQVLAAGGPETQAAGIRDLYIAKEEYLAAAFEITDELFENRDVFLKEGLGLAEDLLARFREAMLES